MKLLQINDTHITSQLGRRKPHYPEQIIAKWEQATDIAIEHGCNCIIHTGDVYHSAVVPRRVSDMVMALLSNCPKQHHIYIGNHDVGTGAPTVTGKSINSLQYLNSVSFEDEDRWADSRVYVHNNDWLHDNMNARTPKGTHIVVSHKDYVLDDRPFEVTKLEDITTRADIMLCGHIHSPWKPVKINGTWYSNPGALSRTFYYDTDFERDVMVALIDTEQDEPITYIPIDVEPIEDVYIERDTSTEEQLERITAELSEVVKQAQENISPLDWEILLGQIEDGQLPEGFEDEDIEVVQGAASRLRELIHQTEVGNQ